jgi:LysM repeat protein
MPTLLHPRAQRAAIKALVCCGLILAACTRSATTATVPTSAPASTNAAGAPTQAVPVGQDATMAAISTQVSDQLTQTAVAAAGTGSGQEATATPGANVTAAPGDTSVPPAGATDTATAVSAGGATPVPTVAVPATQAPAAGAPCANPYTVQSGDWIYKIARNCGVAVSALEAANPGIDPNSISPGQQLNMPAAGATPDPGAAQAVCTGTHTVVSGDNLFRLAYGCGITIEQLAAANGIVYPYTIYPGQVLKFP